MNSKKVLTVGVGQFQIAGLEFLKSIGYFIIGLDGNLNANGRHLCDKFYHCELNNFLKILEIAKLEHVELAIGFECDPAVEAINIVNESIGLPALNDIARKSNLDKLLIRQTQKMLNLNCPVFYEIHSIDELKKIVHNSMQKWVLKPKSSSGSRGVEMINVDSNIQDSYDRSIRYKKDNEALLLEEFIPGNEIAIDGFFQNGECHVLTISFKDRTKPPFLLDEGLLISNDINHPLATEAKHHLSLILKSFQYNISSPFHAEFLHNECGIYLVEYSLRGAGFNVFSKLIPLVSGFNTLEYLINQSLGKIKEWTFVNQNTKNNLYLGFFEGDEGKIKEIIVPEDILNDPLTNEFQIYVKVGDKTNKLKSGADRFGHIVLKGSSQDSLREKFCKIKNNIRFIYE